MMQIIIIYIADYGSKRIFNLNKSMKLLNKVDIKQDSLLWGMSVVGDELWCAIVEGSRIKFLNQFHKNDSRY